MTVPSPIDGSGTEGSIFPRRFIYGIIYITINGIITNITIVTKMGIPLFLNVLNIKRLIIIAILKLNLKIQVVRNLPTVFARVTHIATPTAINAINNNSSNDEPEGQKPPKGHEVKNRPRRE